MFYTDMIDLRNFVLKWFCISQNMVNDNISQNVNFLSSILRALNKQPPWGGLLLGRLKCQTSISKESEALKKETELKWWCWQRQGCERPGTSLVQSERRRKWKGRGWGFVNRAAFWTRTGPQERPNLAGCK